MYDGLISSLRICGRINSEIDNCIAFHDGSCEAEPVCMYELMGKAANAIEELQADKAALNGTVENLLEQIKDLCKPSWIPVTERLPENDCNCIVFSDGYVKESHFYFGKFYDPIEDYMRYKATHWMPLPEPPKEET